MNDARFLKAWLDELERSQWLPPGQIVCRQRRLLARIVKHAAETVPFYRERLDGVFRGGRFDWRRWEELPMLTRQDAVEHREALLSSRIPLHHGEVKCLTTSGSTGIPLAFHRTRDVQLRSQGLMHRLFLWHRFDLSAKMAFILPHLDQAQYPQGERYAHWTLATQLLDIKGELAVLNINTPVERQIEWLQRERPRYLHTVPNNARAIARALAGGRLEGLEKLCVSGESLSEETRAACEEAFGGEIVDRYGAMETSQLALQCPQGRHYHIQSENVFVEILDPEGRPVGPGGHGSIVVTTLRNYAFPLIRYRLGDVVTAGGPCGCGRGLPVITKILGRTRHMFRFPDGSEIWPSLGEAIAPLGPRQWQVAQVGPLDIEVRYVPADPGARPDYEKITALIRDRLNQDASVRFKRVESLAPLPGGKFHDYVNELPS